MDYPDFGRYLIQQRELRGLSRDDVSRLTKISPSMVDALERGQVDRLPSRVFVINYIRAYATAIGMNPEDAVLRFEEIDKTVKSAPPPPALERERRSRAWAILAVVVVALGVAGYLFFSSAMHAAH